MPVMKSLRQSIVRLALLSLILPLAFLAARPATAVTLEGVTLPDTYQVAGKKLELNGIGLRTLTIFNVRIYVAALYLTRPSHDAQQILNSTEPKVLVLRFIHAGSKADVEKEYRKGEENNCADGGCSAEDGPDFEKLVAAAPGVKEGDTSTYIFTGDGVQVLANDQLIDQIHNRDLAKRLLAGFIGAHPPSASLRSALLGNPPE